MNDGTRPVTILSGALGAGKTTTVNHLLTNAGGRKIAVLVNDMGEVNVDADLIENQSGGVAELSNGCICCDKRDDLEVEVSRLAREREFDALVVESSGISEPAPVARLFTTGAASAPYDLDTLVTVVDAAGFRDTIASGEEVTTEDLRRTRAGQVEREGGETRPLSDLLVGQVECADVILLNKCDRVDDGDLDETEALLESLNPRATRIRTTHGQVDAGELVATGRFDYDTVSETAAWQRAAEHAEAHGHGHSHADDGDEAHEDHTHHSPQSEYGIDSFVFRSHRPLHPGRFVAFVESLPASVVRSKGRLHVAGHEGHAYRMSQAGSATRIDRGEQWIAAMPESRQDLQRRMQGDVPWDETWGDRRTELVVIGKAMDEAAIRERLTDCLLTDDELDTDSPAEESPFPGADETTLTLTR
jgi:G3E family GTPase